MWTSTTTADRQTGQPMPSYSIPTPRDPQANFARVPDFNRDVGWPAYFLRLVDAPVGSPGDAARRSTNLSPINYERSHPGDTGSAGEHRLPKRVRSN